MLVIIILKAPTAPMRQVTTWRCVTVCSTWHLYSSKQTKRMIFAGSGFRSGARVRRARARVHARGRHTLVSRAGGAARQSEVLSYIGITCSLWRQDTPYILNVSNRDGCNFLILFHLSNISMYMQYLPYYSD